MNFETIRYEVQDRVASITLNRPERHNAFNLEMVRELRRAWTEVRRGPAVKGMVVGGGRHFIADSDVIVASETATFFDTHVKVGLIAGLEPVGTARRIPLEAVLRTALLGGSERMSAQQALSIWLVDEVVPQAQLLPRAHELAAEIAEHSPTALARSKQAIWESLDGRAARRTRSHLAAHQGSHRAPGPHGRQHRLRREAQAAPGAVHRGMKQIT